MDRSLCLAYSVCVNAKTTTKRSAESPAERLLDAADRLFYEKGYSATGVNELMKEAGVAKASFYHHFPSKVELIIAYLEQRQDRWSARAQEEIGRHSDPARRVLGLFDFLEKWMVSCDFRGCAFSNSVSEFPDRSSAPRERVKDAKKGLRQYIAQLCTEAGHQDRADEVFLLFEGATSQASITGEVWPVHAARDAVRRRIGQDE